MPDSNATHRPTGAQTLLRTCLWLLLGGWFGSYLLFGAVIAPIAFAVLPSTEMAGSLVGPVLTRLHLYGALAGVPLALVSKLLGRNPLLITTPVALSLLCVYSHFGVSAELTEIRHLHFGAAATPEVAARFSQLHRISLAAFIGVGMAVTILIGSHARADARSMNR